MKKWIQILFIGIVLLFISACGTTAKPTGDGKVSGNSSLTLEQVYEKSLTATSNLKSVTLNMDMLQKMQFGADSEPISITMNTDADVLIDPLSMHQTIRMEGMEVTPETEVELYLTQDGVYFFAPESNEWIKMPNEMYEEISQMPTNQLDINEQLKVLQQFIKDFTFEQNDNHYILHLNAAGDKFKDIMKELAPISETAVLGELDILDMFHIEKLQYEIYINKNTFYPENMKIDLDMSFTMEGETLTTSQTSTMKLSNFDKIDQIIVPKEVLDAAVEYDFGS